MSKLTDQEACAAMQAGVTFDHGLSGAADGTPKHLRVGVNVAMSDHTVVSSDDESTRKGS